MMIAHALRTRQQRFLGITLVILSALCLIWDSVIYHETVSWSARAKHAPTSGSQRIAKVSMLYGKPNALYERALLTHRQHGQRWGYPMHILREDISVGFWNKPSYLLALVVAELAKPPGERMEWLMWVDADTIILNGAIPVEIFLPPSDLDDIHLVTARDHNGLNTGIMFLHIHPWTISLLVETLAYPMYLPKMDLGRSADQESMARVLNKTTGGPSGRGYKDGLIYIPRLWINTYEWHHAYEGSLGNLLVHFPGLGEQRWPHMSRWLGVVELTPDKWEVPLEQTEYFNKTTEFWERVRSAKETIILAEEKFDSNSNETEAASQMHRAIEELKTVLYDNADDMDLLQERLESLRAVVGKE